MHTMDATARDATALDVPGLIRRARREADLNQRELAAALGVAQSTIARWERGHAVPDVVQFAAVLALAGITLAALDAQGQAAEPMSDDAPLDRQNRRYPAHLDLGEEPDTQFGLMRLTTPHRRRRDEHRARAALGVPHDHPTLDEFAEQRRKLREERRVRALERARVRARVRALTRPDTTDGDPPACSCPVECEEYPGCAATCPCGCERVGQ